MYLKLNLDVEVTSKIILYCNCFEKLKGNKLVLQILCLISLISRVRDIKSNENNNDQMKSTST